MIYCISDIHGCYDNFMNLLETINFSSGDTLYVLGDTVDRGERPVDCLEFIFKTENIKFIIGNHELMMIDHFEGRPNNWARNGCMTTKDQIDKLYDSDKLYDTLERLKKCPVYETVRINGVDFFLSHAGLDTDFPADCQTVRALTWSREAFYSGKALDGQICIFGHSITPRIHGNSNCAVWFDTLYEDKICIDCGCVYGGVLAALRLDDMAVFYDSYGDKSQNKFRVYEPSGAPPAFTKKFG